MTRLYVLGAGSVGCFLAARLGASLIARGGSVEALRRDGILLGDRVARPEILAADDPSAPVALEPGAWVLVATKLYQLHAAIEELAPRLDGSQKVVLCQNGLGALEEARGVAGVRAASWGRAVCWFGVRLERPNRLVPGGPGAVEVALEGGAPEPLMEALAGAGFEAQVFSTVREVEWRKALWNVSNNGLAALAEVPNGALLEDPGLRAAVETLYAEAAEVARAEGYAVSDLDRHRVFASIERTSANVNSMLQDLRAGRPTELAWLNEAVVARARLHGLRVPANELVAALVRHRERAR